MLTKIVDGKVVVCSPEEESAIRAEWEANDLAPQAEKQTLVDQIINDPLQLAALKSALAK